MKDIKKQRKILKTIKTIWSLIILYLPTLVYGQDIPDTIHSILKKNIISYHFRKAMDYDLGVEKNIIQANKLFFEEFWPEKGHELKLKIEPVEVEYPIDGYKLFHIYKKGFDFIGDSISSYHVLTSFDFDSDYLIAINKKNGHLKFISGNFFRSKIAADFGLKINEPNSFLKYLDLVCYNAKPTKIKFLKHKNKTLYFSGYSELNQKDIIITVNTKNFDDVNIKYTRKYIIY